MGLLLGCQDGEGLVDLHHDDNEEATGQQEGGPEEGEEEGLGTVEALVQDTRLILPSRGEAVENLALVEFGSNLLHIGPGHLVVVQAAWDVGALQGEARAPVGLDIPASQRPARNKEERQLCSQAPGWESRLSKAWQAARGVVLEGVYTVSFGRVVALELHTWG